MMAQDIDSRQIIICDDDEDILCFLGVLVRQAGYVPLIARNMDDILSYVDGYKPGLILLDIRMPETDGFEIAETLQRSGSQIPVIFITAHDNRFSRLYSPSLGSMGYFTKPIDTDALLKRVAEIFSGNAA
jgi:DNA-binding response OmpR family regulator